MVRPIICFAHGSRHPQADAAVEEIAAAVAEQVAGAPAYPAYLDFNPRTLTNVCHLLSAEGHAEATVVPLLFTDAFHMRHDVPEAIAEAHAATGVRLHLAKGLGLDAEMERVVAEQIDRHRPADNAHAPAAVALYNVGKPVPEFAERLARRMGLAPRSVRSFSLGQEDELLGFVGDTPRESPHESLVAPLFVCPGVLWDQLCRRLPDGVGRAPHLGAAVAPVVVSRVRQQQQQQQQQQHRQEEARP